MWLPGRARRRIQADLDAARTQAHRQGRAVGRQEVLARRALDKYDYVFVVTFGRSGSTLVQGLLNRLPRTLIRGENDLYVLHYYRAHAAMRQWIEKHGNHAVYKHESAFFGTHLLSTEAAVQAMNDVMRASSFGLVPRGDIDRIGFKEVLWHRIEPEETEDFFAVFDTAFPGAKYVLNTRDVETTLGSGFWRDVESDAARASIERVMEIQDHLRRTRPERVVDVTFEELTGPEDERDTALARLAEFILDEPAGDDLMETLRSQMLVAHGPAPFERTDEGGAKPLPGWRHHVSAE